MTLELESYRSSNSPVLMHAPLDIPEICARLKQPHEAQRRRADDRRNVGISTVARKRRLSQDDAKSRHTTMARGERKNRRELGHAAPGAKDPDHLLKIVQDLDQHNYREVNYTSAHFQHERRDHDR